MLLFDRVVNFINEHHLIFPHDTIVVGLSGGPDSVFLLHVLRAVREKTPVKLVAVHLDHEWRAESMRDAIFCAQLCARLGVHFVGARASELGLVLRKNSSKEDQGRQMRRALFEARRVRHGATLIALAHHADDQLETFFIRLARGATLSGLAGMRARSGDYIRPLLCVHKNEILQYLHENNISYVTDASNESSKFLRNRIRQTIIPAVRATDDRIERNTQRAMAHLQEADEFLARATQKALDYVTKVIDTQLVIDLEKFCELDQFLQKRVLTQWLIVHKVSFVLSEKLLSEILRFVRNHKNIRHDFNGWHLTKKHQSLMLEKHCS